MLGMHRDARGYTGMHGDAQGCSLVGAALDGRSLLLGFRIHEVVSNSSFCCAKYFSTLRHFPVKNYTFQFSF